MSITCYFLCCDRNKRINQELASMVWKIKIEDLEFLPSMQTVFAKDRSASVISLECMITPLVSICLFSCFCSFQFSKLDVSV